MNSYGNQNRGNICPACGAQNEAGSKFCMTCGMQLNDSAYAFSDDTETVLLNTEGVCPVCGAQNAPGMHFCEHCGSSLEASAAGADSSYRWKENSLQNVCPICGAQNDPDMNFCMQCGAFLKEEPNRNNSYDRNDRYDRNDQNDRIRYDRTDTASAKSGGKSNTIYIILAACVAVLALAVIVVVLVKNRTASPDEEEVAVTEEYEESSDTDSDSDSDVLGSLFSEEESSSDSEDDEESDAEESEEETEDETETETEDEEETEEETSSDSEYILAESDSRYYTRSELEELSDYQLRLARNEIYARHGRMFNDDELQEYFSSKSWYTAKYTADEYDDEIGDSLFNKYEIANRDLIQEIEADRD